MVGSCEHDNKYWGSIKGSEFLELLNALFSVSRTALFHGVSQLAKNKCFMLTVLGSLTEVGINSHVIRVNKEYK